MHSGVVLNACIHCCKLRRLRHCGTRESGCGGAIQRLSGLTCYDGVRPVVPMVGGQVVM